MGAVPFVFEEGTTWKTLNLQGDETVTIEGLANVKPRLISLATSPKMTVGQVTAASPPSHVTIASN